MPMPSFNSNHNAAAGPALGALTVPLEIHSKVAVPPGRQPLTVGIPLPRGRVREPLAATAVDPQGGEICLQTTPLARWSDGSLKWLLLDLLCPRLEPGVTRVPVQLAPLASPVAAPQRVTVRDEGSALVVETGNWTFEIDGARLLPFARVLHGGEVVARSPASATTLVCGRGRPRVGQVDNVQIESRGPVRTTLFLAGRFCGLRGLRFRARICFYAGTGLACFRLAVHNSNRARHPGGLWDLGDEGSILFSSLALDFNLAGSDCRAWYRAEPQQPWSESRPDLEIYQDSSGGDNWQSRAHVNRDGRVPCRFQGYRLRSGEREQRGLRASPTVRLTNGGAVLTAALPEFWQQFPKSLQLGGNQLGVGLFPPQCDDLVELQGGERKTHTLWLSFGRHHAPRDEASASGDEAYDDYDPQGCDDLAWVHAPARALCPPDWYSDCSVIPYQVPAGRDADPRLQEYMQEALHGDEGLYRKREIADEYGWRHYGEVWGDHEQAHYEGPRPVVSHYNNQFDMVDGAIRQMLRSGNPGWYDIFDPLARHVMDIDIYHTSRDRAAYNGGLFWFTDHYRDAATATHRTFSRANDSGDGRPYGGGPGSEHNYATGLLHYYYLTGDPDAFDAVLGLADWVRRMDDGRLTPLGVIDDCPTGLASMCGSLDFHGPGRGAANSIRVLIDAWLLTRRREYLAKAEELVRRCIHPRDDIAALDLLEAERRWSYTMFLSSLAHYLDVKIEQGSLDEMYDYAQQSLVHYGLWMAEHERPWLDRPETLEFPTEAWAVQELRKANVLRLAARHADEEAAERMRARGRELADRAWDDLLRFDSRYVTRAVAVMMTEGCCDAYFRAAPPEPAPHPSRPHRIGPPRAFVPQKTRVLQQLKSPAGVLGAAGRALRVGRLRDLIEAWRSSASQETK